MAKKLVKLPSGNLFVNLDQVGMAWVKRDQDGRAVEVEMIVQGQRVESVTGDDAAKLADYLEGEFVVGG